MVTQISFNFWFCIAISVVEVCVSLEASLFQITPSVNLNHNCIWMPSCLWSMSVLTEWWSYLLSAWELSPILRRLRQHSLRAVFLCARLSVLFPPLHFLRLILLRVQNLSWVCAALDSPNFDGALGYPVTLWSTWGLSCCYLSITLLLPDNGVK